MRPIVIHLLILASLMALGIVLFAMEMLSAPNSGGLIQKFAITKLYWLAIIGYSIGSTSIVFSIGLFHKVKKKSLTPKAVILSHAIPIGLLWVFISLGLHDLIEDAWKNRTQKLPPSPQQGQIEKSKKKTIPIAPTPSRKILKYSSSGKEVKPDEQSTK